MLLVCLGKAQNFSSYICIDDRLQRISRAAEPFLRFSPRLALATKFVGTLVSEGSALDKVGRVAFLVTNVVLSSYFSAQISIASATYSLARSLYQVWQGKAKRGDFFEAFKSFVQMGALSVGGPYLFAMSYAVHAVSYGVDAYRDAEGGYHIEALAHALLSGIYAYQMKPHLQQAYLSYSKSNGLSEDEIEAILMKLDRMKMVARPNSLRYGLFSYVKNLYMIDPELKPLSQSDLLAIPEEEKNFEVFLKKNGFSRHIKRIVFSKRDFGFKDVQNVIFESCLFIGMEGSTFQKTSFIGSSLQKIRIDDCTFQDCTFQNCTFEKSYFRNCKILDSSFRYCLFDQFNALNSLISSSEFLQCSMKRAQLFFATICNSTASSCDFSHTVLPRSAQIQMTDSKARDSSRPVIALGAYLHTQQREEYGMKIEEVMIKEGADVLLYDKIPMGVCEGGEVAEYLSGYSEASGLSRAETILAKRSPDSQIAKIQAIAERIISESQGLLIPGGADVPEFYYKDGVEASSDTYALMEFALLSEAKKAKKPVLGICRGLQLINVFFGGTLKETENGRGIQKIGYVGEKVNSVVQGMFDLAIKKGFFYGYSCHSQAIDKLAPGLEGLFRYRDVIKAVTNQDGTIVGVQFHPEEAQDGYSIFVRNESKRLLYSREDYQKWLKIIEEASEDEKMDILAELKRNILRLRYNPFANLRIYSSFIKSCRDSKKKV